MTTTQCPFPHNTGRQFDHHDPGLSEDGLWATYTALRDNGRVARSEYHGGFWILSRYDDVRDALPAPDVFSSAAGHRIPRGARSQGDPDRLRPAQHTAYREIMARSGAPARP